jgi:hypothetical protein
VLKIVVEQLEVLAFSFMPCPVLGFTLSPESFVLAPRRHERKERFFVISTEGKNLF